MISKVSFSGSIIKGNVKLPASKSISNRVLIIQALCGQKLEIENLSKADDTEVLQQALSKDDSKIDIGHAGTAMRFLTAYFATQEGEKAELTGSERMQERPIGELVNVLRELGASIEYKNKDDFPPLMIAGKKIKGGSINIDASISSQFISALLLIAPYFENGLEINLKGKIVSKTYIQMTLDVMEHFGVKSNWIKNKIRIKPQEYQPSDYTIELDWSAASYLYSMVAFAKKADVFLQGLSLSSIQGDSILVDMMEPFGVLTKQEENGVRLTKKDIALTKELTFDFTDCPDLAQTFIVLCAGLGIKAKIKGVQTLYIKETNRLKALQAELSKLGVSFEKNSDWYVLSGKVKPSSKPIKTYNDHRMAMAFAPLTILLGEVKIENADVVSKSFPEFWNVMSSL